MIHLIDRVQATPHGHPSAPRFLALAVSEQFLKDLAAAVQNCSRSGFHFAFIAGAQIYLDDPLDLPATDIQFADHAARGAWDDQRKLEAPLLPQGAMPVRDVCAWRLTAKRIGVGRDGSLLFTAFHPTTQCAVESLARNSLASLRALLLEVAA